MNTHVDQMSPQQTPNRLNKLAPWAIPLVAAVALSACSPGGPEDSSAQVPTTEAVSVLDEAQPSTQEGDFMEAMKSPERTNEIESFITQETQRLYEAVSNESLGDSRISFETSRTPEETDVIMTIYTYDLGRPIRFIISGEIEDEDANVIDFEESDGLHASFVPQNIYVEAETGLSQEVHFTDDGELVVQDIENPGYSVDIFRDQLDGTYNIMMSVEDSQRQVVEGQYLTSNGVGSKGSELDDRNNGWGSGPNPDTKLMDEVTRRAQNMVTGSIDGVIKKIDAIESEMRGGGDGNGNSGTEYDDVSPGDYSESEWGASSGEPSEEGPSITTGPTQRSSD